MSLHLARVVATHPSRATVDLVDLVTGQRIADVQVMGHTGSDAGSWHVPDVPKPAKEGTAEQLSKSGRNLVAVYGFVHRRPLVTGFLRPQSSQMNFTEQNRSVTRHPSGAYTTIAPDGSIETFHPSGAYLRIGNGVHQDLASVSADGNWQIPAGAAPAQITLATAGFTLTILPNGNATLHTDNELHIEATKTKLTGDLEVSGEVTAKAGTGSSVTLSQHKGHTGGAQPPTPGT